MAIKDYRFVSPGVQIKEIDQSVLQPTPTVIGPVVVGKFLKGPAFTPTLVNNIEEFRDVFGGIITGQDPVTDVWREGNLKLSPSYASIAAEAHLDAAVSPLTVIRMLGEQHSNATEAGKAGWKVGSLNASLGSNSGVFALVLNKLSNSSGTSFGGFNSSSYVAAMFYVSGGSVQLEGLPVTGSTNTSGSSVWIKASNPTNKEFKAKVFNSAGVPTTVEFNFTPTSDKYIRKIFNTNPTLVNSEVASSTYRKNYWLGESFEKFVDEKIGTVSATDHVVAALVPLKDLSGVDPTNFQFKAKVSKTGWVFSQHLNSTSSFPSAEDVYLSGASNPLEDQVKKLFRFVSIGLGEFEQENYKIVVSNIRPPKNLGRFGTFDISVCDINSKDSNLIVREQFTNVNLDKSSENYIARRIGDKSLSWSYAENRLFESGEFDNNSSIVRVEMAEGIVNGQYGEQLLPFGFFGPPRPKKITVNPTASIVNASSYIYSGSYYGRVASGGTNDNGAIVFNHTSSGNLTSSIVFPSLPLVTTITKDISDVNSNNFGVKKSVRDFADSPNDMFHSDLLRTLGAETVYEGTTNYDYSFVFTLDDVKAVSNSTTASWEYGSRYSGSSYTAVNGNGQLPVAENALASGLEINKFTMTLHGGFDGLDITEVEPFKNASMGENDTELTSYVFNSYKIAISSVTDPEQVNMNLLVVPGLTNEALTQYMIDTCQTRADSMAIVDLEDDYKPSHENTTGYVGVKPTNVKNVITSLKARGINSSYAAAYFPWVKMSVRQPQKIAKDVWVPPSVVAFGTYASSEAKTQLWFAPAGFNRGGLKEVDSRGKFTAGFKVTNTAINLTSKQRDELYEVNINPIANFVNEGIVVFGQKTLQVIPSALDRINVRRLLIYLKKQVSLIASGILFDANIDVTWKRFTTACDTLLGSVKSGLGLEDYKIVLDSTTTTDDLVDRNILYAKIYLKPTRAIEYIAVDFIITKSGASFTD